jgi:hypothetical protein
MKSPSVDRSRVAFLLVALPLFLCACGTVQGAATFQGFGVADLERDAEVIAQFDETKGDGVKRDQVTVLLDTLPEGIKVSEGSFGVEEGFQHEIVGKFVIGSGAASFLWFSDFEEGWRKGMCYWQVPLVWVTLTIWIVVPTYYPCFATPVRTKIAVTRDAKALAAAADADTVLMGFIGGSQDETFGAAGLLVRIDPAMKGKIKTKPFKYEDNNTVRAPTPKDGARVGAAEQPSRDVSLRRTSTRRH